MFLTEKASFLYIGASKASPSIMRSMGCFPAPSRWTKPFPSKCSPRYWIMGPLRTSPIDQVARPCTRPAAGHTARRPGYSYEEVRR